MLPGIEATLASEGAAILSKAKKETSERRANGVGLACCQPMYVLHAVSVFHGEFTLDKFACVLLPTGLTYTQSKK